MTTPEEGTDYLDVRSRWQNEAWHFTPWLARNLGMLSAALEVKLQLVQVEKPVGPFFCDILAEEVDTGERVAIENQLEWTDHMHPNHSFSSINVRRDGSIDDPPEKLDETRAWMLDLLPKFKEVFDPRVADVLKELRTKRDG